MSRRADPKRVGLFVVGAFALGLACVVVFGGRNLFAPTERFVLYFEGSVAGLLPGAPVNFRGVRLGQVTNIGITFVPGTGRDVSIFIPVEIELEPQKIQGLTAENRGTTEQMIDHGLRAELGMQSFVTGQLSVELDFRPATTANVTGIEGRYPEIPTLPSDMEKLKASVTRLADIAQELPLEEIAGKIETAISATSDSVVQISEAVDAVSGRVTPLVDDITATVSGIRATVDEARARMAMKPGEVFQIAAEAIGKIEGMADALAVQITPLTLSLQQALDSVQTVAQQAGTVITSVQGDLGPITQTVQDTLASAQSALDRTDSLLDTLDREAGPFIADARTAMAAATDTLTEAREPIRNVGDLASGLDARLDPLLNDAQAAMRSARDTLENSDAAILDLRTLIGDISGSTRQIMTKADDVLDTAQGAAQDARSVIQGAGSLVRPNSPTVAQLEATLAEIRRAATSLRQLADYLERNPNALLTGKR